MVYALEYGLQNLSPLGESGGLPLLLGVLRACNSVVNVLLRGWRDLVEELAGRGSVALDSIRAGSLAQTCESAMSSHYSEPGAANLERGRVELSPLPARQALLGWFDRVIDGGFGVIRVPGEEEERCQSCSGENNVRLEAIGAFGEGCGVHWRIGGATNAEGRARSKGQRCRQTRRAIYRVRCECVNT